MDPMENLFNFWAAPRGEKRSAEQDDGLKKKLKGEHDDFFDMMKSFLEGKVETVTVSHRLVDSPCQIAAQNDVTNKMSYKADKKHLEVNPDHPIIEALRQKAEADKNDKAVKTMCVLLYETALMSAGYVDDPAAFGANIHCLMMHQLGIEIEPMAAYDTEAAASPTKQCVDNAQGAAFMQTDVIELSDSSDECMVVESDDSFNTSDDAKLKPVSYRSQKTREAFTEADKEKKKIKDRAYQTTKRLILNFPTISGDFSQSAMRFEYVPSCMVNALSAAAYPKAPEEWSEQDLNRILEDGNETYRTMMRNEGNQGGTRMLDIEDMVLVENKLHVAGRNFAVEISAKVYGGEIDSPVTGDDDDFYIPLLPALERTFSRHDRAIVLCEEKWFSLGKTTTGYFFYNSHSVTPSNKPHPDGVSRVFFCGSLEDTVALIRFGLQRNRYDLLYGVNFQQL